LAFESPCKTKIYSYIEYVYQCGEEWQRLSWFFKEIFSVSGFSSRDYSCLESIAILKELQSWSHPH
jgi:hypothetical protein